MTAQKSWTAAALRTKSAPSGSGALVPPVFLRTLVCHVAFVLLPCSEFFFFSFAVVSASAARTNDRWVRDAPASASDAGCIFLGSWPSCGGEAGGTSPRTHSYARHDVDEDIFVPAGTRCPENKSSESSTSRPRNIRSTKTQKTGNPTRTTTRQGPRPAGAGNYTQYRPIVLTSQRSDLIKAKREPHVYGSLPFPRNTEWMVISSPGRAFYVEFFRKLLQEGKLMNMNVDMEWELGVEQVVSQGKIVIDQQDEVIQPGSRVRILWEDHCMWITHGADDCFGQAKGALHYLPELLLGVGTTDDILRAKNIKVEVLLLTCRVVRNLPNCCGFAFGNGFLWEPTLDIQTAADRLLAHRRSRNDDCGPGCTRCLPQGASCSLLSCCSGEHDRAAQHSQKIKAKDYELRYEETSCGREHSEAAAGVDEIKEEIDDVPGCARTSAQRHSAASTSSLDFLNIHATENFELVMFDCERLRWGLGEEEEQARRKGNSNWMSVPVLRNAVTSMGLASLPSASLLTGPSLCDEEELTKLPAVTAMVRDWLAGDVGVFEPRRGG